MPIEMPVSWVIVANILGWPVIHLAVAGWLLRLPAGRFHPHSWLFRERAWESGGKFYERVFAVKRWKHRLPDAAPWFPGGFAKRRLDESSPAHIALFVRETCRGEMAHWIMLLAAPVFFLWNPWWADLIMAAYGVLANLPCILVQRHNRLRFARVLARQRRVGAETW